MKKTLISVQTILKAGLAMIMTSLGMSGCHEGRMEYGTPYSTYEIKAQVVDQDNLPIEGLQVDVKRESKITNSEGRVDFAFRDFQPSPQEGIAVAIKDIDGDKNGVVKSQLYQVKISDEDRTGKKKGHWHDGDFKKSVVLKAERTRK